jgi:hypothetical protein
MKSKAPQYFLGLFLTYLELLLFTALGWIQIDAPFTASRWVITLLIALFVRTALFIISHVKVLMFPFAIIGGITGGFGFIPIIWLLGYIPLFISSSVLPNGWFSYNHDALLLFLIGVGFLLIPVWVDDEDEK